MVDFDTSVIDIIDRAPGVKSFRFKKTKEADFKPGQFFMVTIEVEGEKRPKHFSFSNSPTEGEFLEFTKRITYSPFSRALDSLKVGDWAHLKMPYGSFTFTGEHKKVAFLSGGIGITPLRSMCRYATDTKIASDIVLFYGNKTEDGIIFRDDLDKMAQDNKHLRIVYTLTARDLDETRWKGRRGHIDEAMIREEMPDYKDRVFYICGPPGMVKGLTDLLKNSLGIKKENIVLENFTGY